MTSGKTGISFKKEKIQEVCIFILDYISSLDIHGVTNDLFSNAKEKLSKKYDDGKISKEIKGFLGILIEWVEQFNMQDQEKLNELLIERFGFEFSDIKRGLSRAINISTIVKRGKILKDEEYRFIEEHVSNLCQSEPDSPEIAVLNKLLLDYHERRKKANL